MSVTVQCAQCERAFQKATGAYNRSVKRGLRHFCSRACKGLDKRSGLTLAEKRAAKAAYDARRREEKADQIRAARRAAHLATYDPEKARRVREANRDRRRAYIAVYNADPANKARKHEYDIARNGARYGDFAEAWRLLVELERVIRERCPDKYERAKQRGYYDRINDEKRERRAWARASRSPRS